MFAGVHRATLISAIVALFGISEPGTQAAPEPTQETPIFIDVASDGGITLDFRATKIDGIAEYLLEHRKNFGAEDPIVIRFNPSVEIGLPLELRELALKTHHKVHLVVDTKIEGWTPKELAVSDFKPAWKTGPTITFKLPAISEVPPAVTADDWVMYLTFPPILLYPINRSESP